LARGNLRKSIAEMQAPPVPAPEEEIVARPTVVVVQDSGPQANQNFVLDKPLREARDEFEKAYFEYHLACENGSMTRVAEKTGLERTHLYRKLKQLGVDLTRSKRSGAQ
jgi:DNA-binding NtrC family response regulator